MVTYHDRTQPPQRTPLLVTRKWGRFDTNLSGLGMGRATLRLVVFRPGTAPADRFWAHVHGWLVNRELWLLVLLGSFIGLESLLPGLQLAWPLIGGCAVTVCIVTAAWFLARRALADAHAVSITTHADRRGALTLTDGDVELAEGIYLRLLELDRQKLTPVQYEARWSEIYNDLSNAPVRRRTTHDESTR